MRWTPRLRTVLLIVNVIILAMPLLAIAGLRLYDSELIRQTEAELIAQGAFVESTYRHALRDAFAAESRDLGEYGQPAQAKIQTVDGKFLPVAPRLDANADTVRDPAPDPSPRISPVEPAALMAGSRITPILEEAQRITFAGIRVVDAHGTVVASTAGESRVSIGEHEEVQRALKGEFVSLLRKRVSDSPRPPIESISRRTNVRVFVAMPVLHGDRVVGAVVLSRTPMSIAKALYTNRFVFFAMLLALLAGVALITVLTVLTIQRPITALIRQTRKIAEEPMSSAVIDNPGTREFQELSTAFASMAAALAEREKYLTGFARNVSHEFKTPLTSIRGSVELLQDHMAEMEPSERDEFLAVVAAECDRLERLVQGLLELARADVHRPGAETSVLAEAVEAVANSCRAADFDVEVDVGAEIEVGMAREALETVLANVLENARAHGGQQAWVKAEPAGEHVELTVWDDGPGIDNANADRIFEEFFTTARDSGGTGLGLAIIQTMLQVHGASIRLENAASATFVLQLPRSTLK